MDIWTYSKIEDYIDECLCNNNYKVVESPEIVILQIDMPPKILIDNTLREHLESVYNNLGWQRVIVITIYMTELQCTIDSVYLMTERYDNNV